MYGDQCGEFVFRSVLGLKGLTMHIFVTSFDEMSLICTLLYTEVLKYQYMVGGHVG